MACAVLFGCLQPSFSLPALAGPTQQANAGEMSEAARSNLTDVLDKMEKGALNQDSIDWKRVRAETFAVAGNAQTTTDT
jgi:hypothetical protein